MAVGSAEVSIPAADKMGNATVSEHFPKPEMSCMAATLFWCVLFFIFFLFVSIQQQADAKCWRRISSVSASRCKISWFYQQTVSFDRKGVFFLSTLPFWRFWSIPAKRCPTFINFVNKIVGDGCKTIHSVGYLYIRVKKTLTRVTWENLFIDDWSWIFWCWN